MPRYDIPKAAPEPLRQVQLFLNSTDVHSGSEWLPEWLADHHLGDQEARARELREALRELAHANNGQHLKPTALETINQAAAQLTLNLHPDSTVTLAHHGDALDQITAITLSAILDGSWRRLKTCRTCSWAFYDYSPNRSATWCSMKICGNRTKTRAYRNRHRSG